MPLLNPGMGYMIVNANSQMAITCDDFAPQGVLPLLTQRPTNRGNASSNQVFTFDFARQESRSDLVNSQIGDWRTRTVNLYRIRSAAHPEFVMGVAPGSVAQDQMR